MKQILKQAVDIKYLKYLFALLILTDIGYTFIQNYYMMSPDGDMAGIIMPSDHYKKVLGDPFGFNVLFKNEVYAAPNRFFTHAMMTIYFKSFPFLFQIFVNPIGSIFLSMAFARTLFQVLIIGLIATYITGKWHITSSNFITTVLIITPLFQVSGDERFMGVTYMSITYSFFYSGALIFILLYFLPFYKSYFNLFPIKFRAYQHIVLVIVALIIAFGGPIGSPIILIACPSALLVLIYANLQKRQDVPFFKRLKFAMADIPFALLFHFTLIVCLCMYSFFIGRNNIENLGSSLPLFERYKLLPKGFWALVSENAGVSLLLFTCILNIVLVCKIDNDDAKRIFKLIKYVGLFCLLYLLLLPLGGYREYRPLIIRGDTFSPVTICLIFICGLTAICLINNCKGITKAIFIAFLATVMLHFTKVDKINWEGNKCDRDALVYLSNSSDKIVFLEHWCNLMSWTKITDYHYSELNCRLLKYWGVLKQEKLYYQKENQM